MVPFTSKNLEAGRAEPYRKVMSFTFCACIFTDILKAWELILSPETIINISRPNEICSPKMEQKTPRKTRLGGGYIKRQDIV